jgi:transcriptional antiterminator RfaH
MLRWYLVHTKPASESTAVANLLRQGFEVYFPRLLTHVRRARRWQECMGALFPRYLFVGLRDEGQSLATVRSTRGIADIVRFGLQYKPVPEDVLSDLRSRADPASGLHRVERDRRPTPGCAVRIESGPLDQMEGIFERESDADRVHVLLRVLGRAVSVQLPFDAVMKVDS